jgi:hypothetical protein
MPEPFEGGTEPVGGSPIGASGMPVGSEPAKPNNEPASTGDDDYDFDAIDFENLDSVPEKYRAAAEKVAKKMQSSFTKKMQAITKVGDQLDANKPIPPVQTDPQLEDSKSKVQQYMNSPEGAALKEVFDSIVTEKLGTLPQQVQAQTIEKEVSQVVAKYGEELIQQNYDEIEESAKQNPNIPLDYVVSNILFQKAKQIGADEFKAKIARKSQFSDPASSSSSNVVTKKDAGSFEEAFEAAKTTLGF